MKGQIHPDTMIVGDFNTQLSSVHRSSKLEINMVVHQVDLTDNLQNIPSNRCRLHILLMANRTFSKTTQIIGHKTALRLTKEQK